MLGLGFVVVDPRELAFEANNRVNKDGFLERNPFSRSYKLLLELSKTNVRYAKRSYGDHEHRVPESKSEPQHLACC